MGGYIAKENDAIFPAPEELDIFTNQELTYHFIANPFDVIEHTFGENFSGT